MEEWLKKKKKLNAQSGADRIYALISNNCQSLKTAKREWGIYTKNPQSFCVTVKWHWQSINLPFKVFSCSWGKIKLENSLQKCHKVICFVYLHRQNKKMLWGGGIWVPYCFTLALLFSLLWCEDCCWKVMVSMNHRNAGWCGYGTLRSLKLIKCVHDCVSHEIPDKI